MESGVSFFKETAEVQKGRLGFGAAPEYPGGPIGFYTQGGAEMFYEGHGLRIVYFAENE
jgi:hypothetical protein